MQRLQFSKTRASKTDEERRRESRNVRETRRHQKKAELRITYENILKTLKKPEFENVDGASMEPFLKALFYYSMGDRSKPLPLPKPTNARKDYKPILFPEGMTINSRNANMGYEELAKEFGELTLPDEDAVSSIVSIGVFADDYEEPARATMQPPARVTMPQPNRTSVAQPVPVRSSGMQNAYQMNFASDGFGTRLSTPSVYQTNGERQLHTNGQQRNFERRNDAYGGFAD